MTTSRPSTPSEKYDFFFAANYGLRRQKSKIMKKTSFGISEKSGDVTFWSQVRTASRGDLLSTDITHSDVGA